MNCGYYTPKFPVCQGRKGGNHEKTLSGIDFGARLPCGNGAGGADSPFADPANFRIGTPCDNGDGIMRNVALSKRRGTASRRMETRPEAHETGRGKDQKQRRWAGWT